MLSPAIDRRASKGPNGTNGLGQIVERARAFLGSEFRRTLHFNVDMSASPDMRDAQPAPLETFTSMLVLEVMARRSLEAAVVDSLTACVRLHLRHDRIHFFKRAELLPADIDCTSLGVAVLLERGAIDRAQATIAADAVAKNVDDSGHLLAYFQPAGAGRDYVDPAVCTNALYLLHMLGRAADAERTERLVLQFLEDGGHLSGTRYYHSPDTFLFFLARLCGRFPEARARFGAPLVRALDARIGANASALDIATRVLARQRLGLGDGGEREALQSFVQPDGSFPSAALFRAGKRATFYGSAALTTAFAAAALDRRDRAESETGPATYYASA